MADKDFRVKNRLHVNGLTNTSGVILATNNALDSHTNVPTQYGGTGTTQSPAAGQVLFSSAGTTYTPTTLTSLDVKGATYSADAPSNPVVGQVWIESDSSSDSFDPNIIRRKTITATAGQTTFTTDLEFIQGYEQVYFNGMLLLRTDDYTTPSNTSVVLVNAAAAGDIVEILSITNLNSINAATTTTNTFTGAQTINQTLAINTTIQGNSRLQVNYNTTAGGYPWDNSAITIRDNRAMTTGVGGGIIFEGNYLTAGGMSAYGGIRGRKETSTSGDASGFLDIWSRSSGIRFFKSEQNVGSEGTPDMMIVSNGGIGIGTSSVPSWVKVDIASTGILRHTYTGSPAGVLFGQYDVNGQAYILNQANSALMFGTNNTERMRILSTGSVLVNTSTLLNNEMFGIKNTGNVQTLWLDQTDANFTTVAQAIRTTRTNNSAYTYFITYSNNGGDTEHYLRGDGQAYADGSWNGGGADYAEYFEWADGNIENEDRVGYSVALVDNKIKIAEEGDTIIGVISGSPSVVGDHASNKWDKKYLKDDFGRYLRDDNGDRILNPEYDSELEYVSRESRPEWAIVGLMGKLRLRKGQVTGAGWIKMRDISETVEEWLVK